MKKELLYKVSANNAMKLYFNPKFQKNLNRRMIELTDLFMSEVDKINSKY